MMRFTVHDEEDKRDKGEDVQLDYTACDPTIISDHDSDRDTIYNIGGKKMFRP